VPGHGDAALIEVSGSDDGLSCARWAHARVRKRGVPHEICRYAAGGMVEGVGLVKKMLKSLLHSADS